RPYPRGIPANANKTCEGSTYRIWSPV
ncbi:uncharacterized protein METZ01_LOCUS269280, partial [marine metagenome]